MLALSGLLKNMCAIMMVRVSGFGLAFRVLGFGLGRGLFGATGC